MKLLHDAAPPRPRLTAAILTLIALAPAVSAGAQPETARDRAQLFATCEGRFWAMAARQRAIRAPDAPQSEARRQTFGTLLEAVIPDVEEAALATGEARRWQASGWTEIAYLISDTVYVRDERRAAQAARQLTDRLRTCSQALLPED
ncbi:hypothetical protein [Pseudooceanicola sp. LIPI14-2-Ac024]|uniref:hypothetical protein n=1 Tax=Pseudooceanicola sp. LIPI14-2-Ac024 TaxID=3344875 RepID=UPI0035CEDF66